MIWHRIICFGFRLLYFELAWTYDVVSWLVSLGAWRSWQQAALPFVQGNKVLEVGHGPGHMLLELALAGHMVVGLDLSGNMLRQAQRRLWRAGLSARVLQGRVEALPLPENCFDSVLATFPTEYVIQPETLTAVYRTLKPHGHFVIVPAGHLTGSTLVHQFIDWLFRVTGQRAKINAVTFWQPWQDRFAAAGFQTKIHQIELTGSIVTVIVAEK